MDSRLSELKDSEHFTSFDANYPSKLNSWIVFFIYLIAGLAIYYSSLHYGFILDDESQIVNNRMIHQLSNWWQTFAASTMADGSTGESVNGIYYKPIMMMTYSLLWNLGQQQAFLFHLFQLVLHSINAFLIFSFFDQFLARKNSLFCFCVGFLFLCHPVNAEAVLFIADMQEPLYTFFGLSSLLILLRAQNLKMIFAAALLIFAGLLSKESGLLYLLMGLTYCALFNRPKLKYFASFCFIISSAYLGLRLGLAHLSSITPHEMQIARADLLTRLMTIPKVLMHYISLFFYPDEISLTQDWVISYFSIEDFWGPLFGVLMVTGLSIWYFVKRKSRYFLFFTLWFFYGWGLHSQLIPLDGTVSDRWFYFTMIGLLGMISVFIMREFKFGAQRATLAVFIVISLALSVRTYTRTLDWQNALTLYYHDVQVDPDSFYLNNNLGLAIFAQGDYEKAIPYFKKTIAVSKTNSYAWHTGWTNLGASYLFMGQLGLAEPALKQALGGGDVKPFRALAAVLLDLKKIDEFKVFIEQALARFPNDPVLLKLQSKLALPPS